MNAIGMESRASMVAILWAAALCAGGCASGSHAVPDTTTDPADVPADSDAATDTPVDTAGDAADDGGDSSCPAGETPCPTGCTNTLTDHENCGGCGEACASDQVCDEGGCGMDCTSPLVACDGACVDTTTDPLHCGTCGFDCPDAGPADLNMEASCEGSTCGLGCMPGWMDLDAEHGCEYSCTFTGSEICNGVDDDCNGTVDEGFDCVFGEAVLCGTECGSTGTGVCGLGCHVPAPAGCIPPVETCTGIDDDCDGEVDEGWDCVMGQEVACTTLCGGAGSGTCTDACGIPTGADCSQGPEICNGLDDNCNGEADETFDCVMGRPTTCPTACGSTGNGTCSSTCDFPPFASCTPPVESCNGLDDDCVGGPDQTFACVLGADVSCTTACGTAGAGHCTDRCEIPTGSGCAAGVETCNGVDDDCNSLPDDTFPCVRWATVSCVTSCGSVGTGSCSSSCEPPAPAACVRPAETCNGLDDDCDGSADETYACVQGQPVTCTTICGTTGTGTCSASCSRPSAASCTSPAEVCDGLDQDCFGGADNGFPCVMNQPTPCTTACGTAGAGTCSPTCTLPTGPSCAGPAETCNGMDDNCDGTADNGPGMQCVSGQTGLACTTACGGPGSGACSASCQLPTGTSCLGPAEACNGIDDDCDGAADNGSGMQCVQGLPTTCTTTCGSAGTGTCTAACQKPAAGSCAVPAEACNGIDDDCDGTADNGSGMQCVRDATGVSCTTAYGLPGTTSCSASCTLGTCCAAEACNGQDDDCDGTADDGFSCIQNQTGLSCTAAGGAPGTRSCTASCSFTTCCAASETGWCGNGLDDDCDGYTDSADPDCACSFNDDCTCPTVITGSGTWTGDTTLAADDFYGCGSTGGQDVVFQLNLASSSTVTIDTNGSAIGDTVLYILSGSCGGTVVECDDDDGDGVQSYIQRTLAAGTYWIVVDGYSSSYYGGYDLHVTVGTSSGSGSCADPFVRTWPGTATGTTVGFANDTTSWSCQSNSNGEDVVYQLVLASSTYVTIDTIGSSFDTVLAVTGPNCTTEYNCSDDYSGLQSGFSMTLGAGTYDIIVDGYSTYAGAYVLNVSY